MTQQKPIGSVLRDHLREKLGNATVEAMADVYKIWRSQGQGAQLVGPWIVVGVQPEDPIEMIEAVYLAKSKFLHPDTHKPSSSAARFIELNTAMEEIRRLKAPPGGGEAR